MTIQPVETPEWAVCFHSSGNEPGCAACWHGTAVRCQAENERLAAAADAALVLLREVWTAGNAEGRLDELWNLAGRLDAILHPESRPLFLPHPYTTDSYLHGAEPGPPCLVCGESRAAHNAVDQRRAEQTVGEVNDEHS